jgi:ketosteroid isomerase-like protein
MSQENVELVIAANDAYNAGDMDAMMSFYAPDVEAYPDVGFPEARPLIGREEFMSWLEGIDAAWVDAKWVAREVFAVDDGRVVYRGDWGGEGLASGVETASSITGVVTIRDGQISRVEFFFDHDAALKAVGLEE